MLDVSKNRIEISCPGCSSRNTVTLGQVADQKSIACSDCKKSIDLVDDGGRAKKAIQDINKGVDDLTRTIRNMNK